MTTSFITVLLKWKIVVAYILQPSSVLILNKPANLYEFLMSWVQTAIYKMSAFYISKEIKDNNFITNK